MVDIINACINKIQKDRSLTQGQIEKCLDMGSGHLSHLKRGTKNVNWSTVRKLVKFAKLEIAVIDKHNHILGTTRTAIDLKETK